MAMAEKHPADVTHIVNNPESNLDHDRWLP
jgi:hypothetical protein